jgi:hypothetical protein
LNVQYVWPATQSRARCEFWEELNSSGGTLDRDATSGMMNNLRTRLINLLTSTAAAPTVKSSVVARDRLAIILAHQRSTGLDILSGVDIKALQRDLLDCVKVTVTWTFFASNFCRATSLLKFPPHFSATSVQPTNRQYKSQFGRMEIWKSSKCRFRWTSECCSMLHCGLIKHEIYSAVVIKSGMSNASARPYHLQLIVLIFTHPASRLTLSGRDQRPLPTLGSCTEKLSCVIPFIRPFTGRFAFYASSLGPVC